MKAAMVNLDTGELRSDRYRIDTPTPSTPDAMADVVVRLVEWHGWEGPVGCAFPAVVHHGRVRSAANIDSSWIGVNADELFSATLGHQVTMINDADAAGMAEMRFGVGRDRRGVVLMLTFGTGIGSGLFIDGTLVPNTEFGHLELDGVAAETRAAAIVRKRERLSWPTWAARVEHYLRHLEMLLSPELIIVGGGASKSPHKWLPHIDSRCDLMPAEMANNAGIIGAALL